MEIAVSTDNSDNGKRLCRVNYSMIMFKSH